MTFRERMLNDDVKPLHPPDDYQQWRGCQRKRRYSRWADAEAAAKRTGHGVAYACNTCHGFHVGHVGEAQQ